MIKFTNTLSGTKEEFTSIKPNIVGMYNCGPTVYDYAHIGNLRKYIFDDVVRRVLEWNGYTVHQIINITDVGHIVSDADSGDDKIEISAKKEQKTAQEIANFFTDAFYEDLDKLNIEAVADKNKKEFFPKATDHISEQIELIQKLEHKGFTYTTTDGVYFDTAKFPEYGKLGNIDLAGLKEGARVEANAEKRNPTDFALWKFSPANNQRQQEWPSPWGVGFPGWHIECSAMSMKYLGETFDIHTGGIDHIPVHHNNEIAQSEAATGKQFVHYWLHEAFVNVDGAKMAKSLNNFYRLTDLEAKNISPLAYRYWILTAHYSTAINFTWEAIEGANTAYHKLGTYILLTQETGSENQDYLKQFTDFINDDVDTAKAIALIWKMLSEQTIPQGDIKATILAMDKVLGLELAHYKQDIPQTIIDLKKKYDEAKKNKDYTISDSLREDAKNLGWAFNDTKDGSEVMKIL